MCFAKKKIAFFGLYLAFLHEIRKHQIIHPYNPWKVKFIKSCFSLLKYLLSFLLVFTLFRPVWLRTFTYIFLHYYLVLEHNAANRIFFLFFSFFLWILVSVCLLTLKCQLSSTLPDSLLPRSQLPCDLWGAHWPLLLISLPGVSEVHLGCGADAGNHPSSPLLAPSPAAPYWRSHVDPARHCMGPHLQSR